MSRFNAEGIAALEPRHGGGSGAVDGPVERERIVRAVRRTPERSVERSAQGSLPLLQRVLQTALDGFPALRIDTLWRVLHAAGLSWQRNRSWCETGQAVRQRQPGTVRVTERAPAAKKS